MVLPITEDGIPEDAKGRIMAIERVLKMADDLGISYKHLVIDPLVLPLGAKDVRITLDTLKIIKNELGLWTVMGLSNVSHGLPHRGNINNVFLSMALHNGLDMVIADPAQKNIRETILISDFILRKDKKGDRFIGFTSESSLKFDIKDLKDMIIYGEKEKAVKEARKLILEKSDPFSLIEDYIMPALAIVGDKYEKKIKEIKVLLLWLP